MRPKTFWPAILLAPDTGRLLRPKRPYVVFRGCGLTLERCTVPFYLRVRRISLTADAPSFKVKVPRTSRAGVNETLTGEQVAARLVSVMRSRAHRGKTMDEWRKEQLAWLLDPVRPAKKG